MLIVLPNPNPAQTAHLGVLYVQNQHAMLVWVQSLRDGINVSYFQ